MTTLGELFSLQRGYDLTEPQRRIGPLRVVGSAYDDLIENCQRRIQILEAMVRVLYREWFVEFRFPGHETAPPVASHVGDIPRSWEGHFGDLVTISRDGINPFEYPSE